jgi:hypothetical protein
MASMAGDQLGIALATSPAEVLPMQTMLRWLGVGLLSTSLTGCIFAHYDSGDDATLTVRWRIDGNSHADDCVNKRASDAYIVVRSNAGIERTLAVECQEFEVDLGLTPGEYWVTVALRDDQAENRTVRLQSESLELHRHDRDSMSLNFDHDAFVE